MTRGPSNDILPARCAAFSTTAQSATDTWSRITANTVRSSSAMCSHTNWCRSARAAARGAAVGWPGAVRNAVDSARMCSSRGSSAAWSSTSSDRSTKLPADAVTIGQSTSSSTV